VADLPTEPVTRPLAARPTRRLEVASTAWTAAESVYLVGLVVVAYRAGGPPAVALVALLQSLPSVVLAPLVLSLAEAIARERLLRGVLVVRFVAVGLAAIVLAAGGAAALVYALAAIDAVASTLLRPLRGALIPMIARSPDELVSANVAVTTGASAAGLAGPALAAVLLTLAGPEPTFLAGAFGFAAAIVVAARIQAASDVVPLVPARGRSPLGGLVVLRELGPARAIVAVVVGQRFVRGMLTVLVATTALDLLAADDAAVGLLNAAIGTGALAGSILSFALVRRTRLALAFSGAVAIWGAALAAPAVVPVMLAAVLFFALSGAGKAVLEVAGASLLQRTIPSSTRSQALGALESMITLALAAGAVSASLLVAWLGADGALLAAGALSVGLTVATWPGLRAADDAAVIPEREMTLLRAVPFFRPLPLVVIERLAGALEDVAVAAGSDVVREGDPGDLFYIVEMGRLETRIEGRLVRELGPGDSFGEIALLREVPRTATVRAVTDVRLAALARGAFLEAVTGHGESSAAAEAVVRARAGI
jgi:MFS family permease